MASSNHLHKVKKVLSAHKKFIQTKVGPQLRRGIPMFRIVIFLLIFVLIALAAFIFSGKLGSINGNFDGTTGNAVGTDSNLERIQINENFTSQQTIQIQRNVVSLKLTGTFVGNGSARVYAIANGTRILVYEFKQVNISSVSPTGFVVFDVPIQDNVGVVSENLSISNSIVQDNISLGDLANETVINESSNGSNNEQSINESVIDESIVNASIINNSVVNESVSNESILNESSLNDSNASINISINESVNESTNITGSLDENISSGASSENVTSNVTDNTNANTTSNLTSNVGDISASSSETNVSVVDVCLESCSIFPTFIDSIVVEVDDGELSLESIGFVSPEKGVSLSGNFSDVSLNVGSQSLLDLSNHFSGNGVYFDFSSSEGYDYEITGGVLKIVGVKEGSWPAKVYAVKNGVIVESNEFLVVVTNPFVDNSSLNMLLNNSINVVVNNSFNISENLSSVAALNFSSAKLSPELEEALLQNSSVRVLIKTKEKPNYVTLSTSKKRLLGKASVDTSKDWFRGGAIKNSITQAELENLTGKKISSSDLLAKYAGKAFLSVKNSNNDLVKVEQAADNFVSTDVDVTAISQLVNSDDVEFIELDKPFSVLTGDSLNITRTNYAFTQGLTGAGKSICIIDTGVSPSAVGRVDGLDLFGYNVLDSSLNYSDVNGHGTKVAYVASSFAPGAKLYVVKAVGDSGVAYSSDLIAALNYCAQQNVSVVSLSLGGGSYSGYCDDDPVAAKINDLADSGILTVVATGNNGWDDAVTSPACASKALSVGASTKGANESVASFSNYNNATFVVAPGQNIITKNNFGDLVSVSGTSMSAPMVAGVAAILQENQTLTVADVKDRLIRTGKVIEYEGIQFSRVDAYNAIVGEYNNISLDRLMFVSNVTSENASNYTLHTNINTCQTLSSAGGSYTLTASISGDNCILISAANIVLDCAGYTITSTAGWGNAVQLSSTNITVKNCIVSGRFSLNSGCSSANITNTNITSSIAAPLLFNYGGSGSTFNTMIINGSHSDSTIKGDDSATNVQFNNCNIYSSASPAVYIQYKITHAANFTNCKIFETGNYDAVILSYFAKMIFNNVTINSSGNGRAIYTTDQQWAGQVVLNQVTATASSNYALDLNEMGPDVVANSTFTSGNTVVNFKIYAGSNFTNNTLVSSDNNDVLLLVQKSNNRFWWNNFSNTSAYYINDTAGSNTYNTTISGVGEGNIYFNVFNGSVVITGSTTSGYGTNWKSGSGGSGYPYNKSTSGNKVTSNVVDSAPLIQSASAVTFNLSFYTNTPADNSRQTANSVIINVTVNVSSGSISACILQWTNSSGTYNSSMTLSGTQINVNCSSTMATIDGASYTFKVYANDTLANYANTSNRTFIENAVPSISSSSITPSVPLTNNNLTCSPSGWSDSNSDSAQYYYQWYNGSTLKYTTGPTSATNNNLSSGNLSSDDVWNCTITPYDGYENGTSKTNQVSIGAAATCTTYSTANKAYALGANLSSSGNCFVINANNVTIDCNNYWIVGPGTGSLLYTNSNNQYFTLKNCNIKSHSGWIIDGEYGPDDMLFQNIYVLTSASSDIVFYLNGSDRVNLTNVTINGSTSGFNYGVYSFTSSKNLSVDCRGSASITGANGSEYALFMADTDRPKISNCVVSNVYEALHLEGATSGVYSNNSFSITKTGTGANPVYLSGSSTKNHVFVNNTFLSPTSDLVYIATSGASNNTFYWNNFTNTSGLYVNDIGGSNYYNYTNASGQAVGNIWFNVLNGSVSIAGSVASTIAGYYYGETVMGYSGYPYNSSNGLSKVTSNVVDYAPLTTNYYDYTNRTCTTIYNSQTITLNANINSSATCYKIYAPSVTLNCAGYSIKGTNASDSFGIYSNASSTKIINCIISNYSGAINFTSATSGLIANSTLSTTFTGGYAILLASGSNSSTIYNNTLSSAGDIVFLSTDSNSNLFYWNNFTNTSGYYVNDTNKSNYYNTTINGVGEGNIWFNVMNGSVDVKGTDVYSSGYPALLLGSSGAGYPYNSSNSLSKVTLGVVDYAPITNVSSLASVTSCQTLSTPGTTYLLANNINFSSDCFIISGANIVLNCNNKLLNGTGLNYVATIAVNATGVTVKNCNMINVGQGVTFNTGAGNDVVNNVNINATSRGIYSTVKINNITITNFYINDTAASTPAIYLYGTAYTISNCTIYSSGTAKEASAIYADVGATRSKISNCNITMLASGASAVYLDGVQNSNNNISVDGVILNATSKTFAMGNIQYSNITNSIIHARAGSNAVMSLSGDWGGHNVYSNLTLITSSDNALFLSAANGYDVLKDSNLIAGGIVMSVSSESGVNITNNTFTSTGNGALLSISSSGNLIWWNNFTNTSGVYINDTSSSPFNTYNTTISSHGEGNIYFNILNGSVVIKGRSSSTGYPSLYYGNQGTNYPYNSSNSGSKVTSNVYDYAPLTNQLIPCTINSNCSAGEYCNAAQLCVAKKASTGTCDYTITYTNNVSESNGVCSSGYCHDDYDTSGNDGDGSCETGESCWCVSSSTACATDATEVANGTNSSNDCKSTGSDTTPGQVAQCSNGSWIAITCGYSNYNQCNGVCQKGRDVNFCSNATNTCSDGGNNLFEYLAVSGKVCSGGSEVDPSSGVNCDSAVDCSVDNSCSAARYYRGCAAGTGSCTETNKQTYASWYPSSNYVIVGAAYASGSTCSQNQDFCNATAFCSGEVFYGGYWCNGTGNCNVVSTPHDKDEDSSYCTSTGPGCTARYWNIGGEVAATTCCGDDVGEYKNTRVASATMHNGFATNTSDDACCTANNSCVSNSVCYANGDVSADVDGNGDADYCNAGTWYDCNTDAQCNVSGWFYCSNNECMQGDIPPVMNSSRILPSVAYVNDTLKGYCSANDGNGDNVSYYYQWYRDGVLNASGVTSTNFTQATEVNVANISAGLVKGQNWLLGCLATDDASNSSWMNSSNATISNYLPSITSVSISPTFPTTANDLNCSASGFSDADADGAQYYFQWYNGSTLFSTSTNTSQNWSVLKSGNLTGGDTWNCTVTPYDGTANGSSLTNSTSILQGDCGALSVAGRTYTLGSNVSISDTNCFNVTAVNVTLDCNGYSITGNNASGSFGVYSYNFNTTVKNCNISNFATGIYFNAVSNGVIDNNTVSSSFGYYPPSGLGIYLSSGASNNVISNNRVTKSGMIGLLLFTSTNSNVVRGNNITATGNFGAYMQDANNNNLSNNIFTAASYSLYLNITVNNSKIINNTFISSNGAGTLLGVVSAATANIIYWNNFTNTSGSYIIDDAGSSSTNVYNTTINGHGEGNVYFNVLNKSIDVRGVTASSLASNLYVGVIGSGVPYNSSMSGSKVSSGIVDYAPLTNWSNAAPVVNLSRILPLVAYTGDSLKGYCSANDADGDTLRYYYVWYKNGAVNVTSNLSTKYTQATEVNVANISSGLVKSQVWTLVCLASDDASNSSWLNSSNLTISNSLPSISGINISPTSVFTTTDLNCSVSGFSDLDGDSAQYYFQWYNGSTLFFTSTNTSQNWSVLKSGNLSVNDVWNCTVKPYDGTSNGTALTTSKTIGQNCGNIASGVITIINNLTSSGATCFTITSSNVTIDCNSHSITGDSTSNTYGVYSTYVNTTIKNCIFSNFTTSIYLNESSLSDTSATNGTFINNTFLSNSNTHVYISAQSTGNIFCLNNFTNTSGSYVNDTSSGGNYYNCTYAGLNQGNIWSNVIDRSVVVRGNISSSISGLYLGSIGSGQPYTTAKSLGKLSGTITDNAPLTDWFESAPVMNSSRILPTVAYKSDTLKGYCSANDNDGDNIYYYYIWYKNATSYATGVTSSNYTQATEVNVDSLSAGVQNKGENWMLGCRAFDGSLNSSWINSSAVTIQNTPPPKVTLQYPENNNDSFTNRTPEFNWTGVTDVDGDNVTYSIHISTFSDFSDTVINRTGLSSNYYDFEGELGFRTYYWRVQAYDGTSYGSWSDSWNFTVQPYVSVHILNNNINFNSIAAGATKDTTTNNPSPFIFKNYGNTYVDLLSMNISTSIWTTQSLNTSYWQFKARSTANDGTFNESGSFVDWFNATNISYVVRKLNYSVSNSNVSLDTLITVPTYESVGTKSSTLTFIWEAAS